MKRFCIIHVDVTVSFRVTYPHFGVTERCINKKNCLYEDTCFRINGHTVVPKIRAKLVNTDLKK